MKSDTTTTKMSENKNRLVFKSRDFYNDFNSSKNNFRSLGRKKEQRKVSYTLYQKIIKRFLLIYFYEVFFVDKPFFFFLGGKVKRCRISQFFTKQNTLIKPAVSFLWFLRPHVRFVAMVRVDIQKGSTAVMPKIRKEFMEKNDVGLLPLKNNLRKQYIENNLMYVQDE